MIENPHCYSFIRHNVIGRGIYIYLTTAFYQPSKLASFFLSGDVKLYNISIFHWKYLCNTFCSYMYQMFY
jgi:hypothetical protein